MFLNVIFILNIDIFSHELATAFLLCRGWVPGRPHGLVEDCAEAILGQRGALQVLDSSDELGHLLSLGRGHGFVSLFFQIVQDFLIVGAKTSTPRFFKEGWTLKSLAINKGINFETTKHEDNRPSSKNSYLLCHRPVYFLSL